MVNRKEIQPNNIQFIGIVPSNKHFKICLHLSSDFVARNTVTALLPMYHK